MFCSLSSAISNIKLDSKRLSTNLYQNAYGFNLNFKKLLNVFRSTVINVSRLYDMHAKH